MAEKNGYNTGSESELYTLITAEKYHLKEKLQRLIVAKTTVIPQSCRPAKFKLCNMLHYRDAYREAQKKEADDAVMLTVDGVVSETSIANLFWKKSDTFYTPSKQCDILPGITRKYVIDLIKKMEGFSLKKGEFTVDELMRAESAWVTNSLMEIQPVASIDDQKLEYNKQLTLSLKKAYQSVKELDLNT
jgi:branched-subunit amino acid aminotransferase/4-amino-4-deoxychorismate lyase